MWGVFGKHHYLSAEFNKASELFLIYWENTLVGMFSTLAMPNGSYKYAHRVHRTVILPDYQGLGIGTKILDWFGNYYLNQGKKLFIKSTHIRIANHCRKHIGWLESSSSGKSIEKLGGNQANKYKNMILNRPAFSFEYVGEDYAVKPHKTMVIDDQIISKDELMSLKEKYYLTIVTGKPKEDNETELMCKELGIRTEQLYVNKCGELRKKDKYQ